MDQRLGQPLELDEQFGRQVRRGREPRLLSAEDRPGRRVHGFPGDAVAWRTFTYPSSRRTTGWLRLQLPSLYCSSASR